MFGVLFATSAFASSLGVGVGASLGAVRASFLVDIQVWVLVGWVCMVD